MNGKKILNNFNKYKYYILEELISYYGEEYKYLIIERFLNTYFDFTSFPTDDEKYYNMFDVKKNSSDVITDFKIINEHIKNVLDEQFISYIVNNLKKCDISLIYDEISSFLNFFTSPTYDESDIDCFSSKYDLFMDDEKLGNEIKNDRYYFIYSMNKYGIDKEQITKELVDKIIRTRKSLRKTYYRLLIKYSKYGSNLYNSVIKSGFDVTINDVAGSVNLDECEIARVTQVKSNGRNKTYSYLKFPIYKLLCSNKKELDVTLIHEIVHAIEANNDGSGIYIENNNKIINEIRVQRIATLVAENLHSRNIYIFDREKTVYQPFTIYERLNSTCYHFLEKHDDILKKIAITNSTKALENMFGLYFKFFSMRIEQEYNRLLDYVDFGKGKDFKPINLDNYIDEMDKFYDRKVKSLIRKRNTRKI